MKLDEQILNLVRKQFGSRLSRPSEFEALAEDIYEKTGERLGVNTLKRLFGTIADVTPVKSTLDIVARYVGYPTFALLQAVCEGTNSDFAVTTDAVFPDELPADTLVTLTYEPHRRLLLMSQPDHRLCVVDAGDTKLAAGDLLSVADLRLGSAFFAKNVERNGHSLSTYAGGIEGGITSLTVTMPTEELRKQ